MQDVRQALPLIKRLGIPLYVHAELPHDVQASKVQPRCVDGFQPNMPQHWQTLYSVDSGFRVPYSALYMDLDLRAPTLPHIACRAASAWCSLTA